jgi:hypothetical protein
MSRALRVGVSRRLCAVSQRLSANIFDCSLPIARFAGFIAHWTGLACRLIVFDLNLTGFGLHETKGKIAEMGTKRAETGFRARQSGLNILLTGSGMPRMTWG